MRFADFDLDGIEMSFATCIARLEASVADVPPGWHSIYLDCVQDLRGVENAERALVEVGVPTVHRGRLLIEQLPTAHSQPDAVVQGILRKLAARSVCTCQLCGKPGWLRSGQSHPGTYCADCWTPRALRSEISDWLDRMNQEKEFKAAHPVVLWDALGVGFKAVVPDDALHTLQAAGRTLLCITAERFLQLREQLKLLKATVDEQVALLDASEYRWHH
ncbi:MAG: hypothetical protein ACK4OH_15345 [Acidovorax temperans]|uniref:hypothetical protein n=1 Tax=Acidovorax temperans TaxID=80878 RepID=UPI00391D9BCC